MTINFDATADDAALISDIVDRWCGLAEKYRAASPASEFPKVDKRSLSMDLTACHLNGTPLKLEELLEADDFNFIHDVGGIRRHMDRRTGKLTDCFLPRFARPLALPDYLDTETATDEA